MKFKLLLLLVNFIFIGEVYNAQSFADKNYYLVDSLVLEDLADVDLQLIDSCLTIYHTSKDDTSKINAISIIVEESWDDNVWPKYNQWIYKFAQEKLTSASSEKILLHLRVALAGALNNIGYLYKSQGNIPNALNYYRKSLKLEEELGNKRGIALSLNNIGSVYIHQGDITNALEYFHKSLKLEEELGNERGIALLLNNIGAIYYSQGNIPNALNYYRKSLKLEEEIGDKEGIATSLNNIGLIYDSQGETPNALEYYHKSLTIREEMGDKQGIATSLNNIGYAYSHLGDVVNALEYYHKSLKIQEEMGDKQGIATSLSNIGTLYYDKKNLVAAKKYATRSFNLAQELGFPEYIKAAANLLSRIYEMEKQGMPALKMYKLYITMRDSILNEENDKTVAQQQAKYEYEKKAASDSIKNAEAQKVNDALLATQQAKNKQHQIEAQQQKQQAYFLYGGLGLALLFGGFIFNRFRITQKQKEIIEAQKAIVEQQKLEVENTHEQLAEHHKEIQDSINYAKRIQEAIMPSMESMNKALRDGFVLYQPKDVVAGDFFWMEIVPSKKEVIYFAAADCTGHGVPGAMVSVVCSNALTKSLLEEGITDVGQILDRTREIVIERLAKSGEEVKDGMDISLCALNTQSNELQWSGANNPLWILRKGANSFEETKADKQPIGMYSNPKPFSTNTFQLNKGDGIYVFTDGYQDQFGGPKGKKLKAKPLKQLIIENQSKSMEEQKEILQSAFSNWQGKQEQVDDVCMIGVRV